MRIVHTSDWHAGRVWKGIDRLPELEAVLDHLADFVLEEGIDLLLHTGDVFETGAPAARAERLVFRFLKRVGVGGVPVVVIAGNHDSAARLEAWGQLAELAGVHARGRPRPPDEGGLLEIATPSGERARIGAVPFAAPRQLVSALDLAKGDSEAAGGYADRMGRIFALLASRFRDDSVNLLLAHTHLHGAAFSGSERKVHLGDEWAATAQALPPDAHYVALGHLHRPQKIDAPSPTRYAGSPLQLDFGEEGEEKSFVVVEAVPGRPARLECVPYEGGRPLGTVEAGLAELEARADELRDAGWLRVRVPLGAPDPDLNRKVRALLPNAVAVDVALPERQDEERRTVSLREHTPAEVFAAYFERRHGGAPSPALVEAFEALYEELGP